MLSPDSRIVLINAIYFNYWEREFSEKMFYQKKFHNSEMESVSADFMHIEDKFNCILLDDLDAAAVEMKYVNSSFSFIVAREFLDKKRNSSNKVYTVES